MDRGSPRVSANLCSTALTLEPVSEASTSIARHSRVQSSTMFKHRILLPSAKPSDTKSIDQLWLACSGLGKGLRSTKPMRLRFLLRTARPASRYSRYTCLRFTAQPSRLSRM
jgi:hypothetical protein